jgi:hypothetical protein
MEGGIDSERRPAILFFSTAQQHHHSLIAPAIQTGSREGRETRDHIIGTTVVHKDYRTRK